MADDCTYLSVNLNFNYKCVLWPVWWLSEAETKSHSFPYFKWKTTQTHFSFELGASSMHMKPKLPLSQLLKRAVAETGSWAAPIDLYQNSFCGCHMQFALILQMAHIKACKNSFYAFMCVGTQCDLCAHNLSAIYDCDGDVSTLHARAFPLQNAVIILRSTLTRLKRIVLAAKRQMMMHFPFSFLVCLQIIAMYSTSCGSLCVVHSLLRPRHV